MKQGGNLLRVWFGASVRRSLSKLKISHWSQQYAKLVPRILAFAAIFLLVGFAEIQGVYAFTKKAVEQLMETHKCLRCDLRRADLSYKNLKNVDLSGAYLIQSNMEGANLKGAKFSGAWMNRTNLRRANLEGAILRGAHLIDTDLTGANLRRANLQDAMMARAVLVGADLRGAKLSGAKLQGTEFRKVIGIEKKQLSKACGDADTKLPSGLLIISCGEGVR